jgi:ABC-2 type transport system permease protein
MPIHDQGYRRYAGQRGALGRGWMIIAKHHLRTAVKYKPFVILLIACWGQFVVQSVRAYVSSAYPVPEAIQFSSGTYRDFLAIQGVGVFLISIAMAGLIADDKRANALQVYLSKPLTRVEYIAGKLAALLVLLLGITFLPAMLLLVMQMLFAGSTQFLRENLFLLPAITLYSVVQALFSGFALLALSSLSKSRRFVAVMYAGVLFFTAAMYQALRNITTSSAWAVIAPGEMLDVLGDAIFRVKENPAVPPAVAALVILLMIGLSIWVLERKVRGIEVVA